MSLPLIAPLPAEGTPTSTPAGSKTVTAVGARTGSKSTSTSPVKLGAPAMTKGMPAMASRESTRTLLAVKEDVFGCMVSSDERLEPDAAGVM